MAEQNLGATSAEWVHFGVRLGLREELLPMLCRRGLPIARISKLKYYIDKKTGELIDYIDKTPTRYYLEDGVRRLLGIGSWSKHNTTEAEFGVWRREPDYNLCINARRVRGLDVDVEDPGLAAEIDALVCDMFLLDHGSLPRRTRAGSPRGLYPIVAPGELRKQVIKTKHGKLELLATGQQFVACGLHIKSGTRYEWPSGLPNTLPEASVDELLAVWEELDKRFGLHPAAKPQGAGGTAKDEDGKEPAGKSVEYMRALLRAVPGVDDHDTWIETGQVLHFEFSGDEDGFSLWNEWSMESASYVDEDDLRARWASFGKRTGKLRTVATLIFRARKADLDRREFEADQMGLELDQVRLSEAMQQFEDVNRSGTAAAAPDDFEAAPEAAPSAAGGAGDTDAADGAAEAADATGAAPGTAIVVADTTLPSSLLYDNRGRLKEMLCNMAAAINLDKAGWRIRYDAFKGMVVVARVGTDKWTPLTDIHYSWLRAKLERFDRNGTGFTKFGGGNDLVRQAVRMVAEVNTFDSAQEIVGRLEWDCVPRVDRFLELYFGVRDTPYHRAVSRYIWTALAGRVWVPGIKADMVPVLIGKQGLRKTTSVTNMVFSHEQYASLSLDIRDADMARHICGKLIGEIEELKGLGSRDEDGIKAFFSKTHERWIPKYLENERSYGRRLLFIATANKKRFLEDITGNRRWLPVVVQKADAAGIARDRDLLWAEASREFNVDGVAWQAEQLAIDVHKDHMVPDAWSEPIREWLNKPCAMGVMDDPAYMERGAVGAAVVRNRDVPFTLWDVMERALGSHRTKASGVDQKRAAKALDGLGFRSKQAWVEGDNIRVWVPKTGADDEYDY